MQYYFWVAAGGALGAVSRVVLQQFLNPAASTFPLGTFLANVAGSFVIGFLAVAGQNGPSYLQPLVMGGCLGALTTMSSFVLEVTQLSSANKAGSASLYLLATITICLAVCYIGVLTGRWLTHSL